MFRYGNLLLNVELRRRRRKNVDRINITNCIYISLLTIDITKKKEKKIKLMNYLFYTILLNSEGILCRRKQEGI